MIWVLAFGVTAAADSSKARDGHVEVELISALDGLKPGGEATLALRLAHDPKWHSYWINPGESGLATAIEWDLPDGFEAGPIAWPVPEVTDTGGLVSYGYGGEIFLLIPLSVPADLEPGTEVTLGGRVDWLQCKEMCLPGRAQLSLTLPVSGNPQPGEWAERIEAVRSAQAKVPSAEAVSVTRSETGYILEIGMKGLAVSGDAAKPYFFSEDLRIDAAAEQVIEREEGLLRLRLAASALPLEQDDGIFRGVLALQRDLGAESPALRLDVPLSSGAAAAAPRNVFALLGLAFVGGLILNLMPCVFPVLGIKIMGFVNQASESRQRAAMHGLVFTAGVLVSFWVLAGLLLALRSAGSELGWGFQLQSPRFVFVMAGVLLGFGLNMSGVFEIGMSAVGIGSGLTSKKGFSGSFFSGALATLVATPCAAPFLAPALGAALALSGGLSILVFTVIALGLASPYLLFAAFPGWLKVLPKPGAWMETFKQFMAFLLYATVAYLVWVLAGLLTEAQFLSALIGLVVLAFACWVYGRWTAPWRPVKTRVLGRGVTLAFIAGAFWLGFSKPGVIEWETWSEARVAELREDGRLIYVDFTARWCATCQVNKRVVFSSEEVIEVFREKKVAALKADWTKRDTEITRALAALGRRAVPVNLVYLPDADDPVILPEVLTPGIVLDALRGESERDN